MALFPTFNPWTILRSSEKVGTCPQQYIGITYDGTVKHYYPNIPLGTGIILHREDGPAVIWENGEKFWYYKGHQIDCKNLDEFQRILKLKVFL